MRSMIGATSASRFNTFLLYFRKRLDSLFEVGYAGLSVVFHRRLRVEFQKLLAVNRREYSDLFSTVEHQIGCGQVPPASVRLHFVRHDDGGLVPMGKVVDTLISYITHFCFTSERRADLSE